MRVEQESSMRAALVALVAVPIIAFTGCSWFTDFRSQPKIEPWEAEYARNDTTPFRGNTPYSVPITGKLVPAFEISYSPSPITVDSMSSLPNPHQPTPASLDNGRKYYQINCAVCHGVAGKGNGSAVRYGIPAPSLLTDRAKGLTDGYIWGMIRNGRGIMPTYDRIEEPDRWDVVNYIRSLQGKYGAAPDTAPAGYPGQNGRAVPGFTRTAPTRPVPYRVQGVGGLADVMSADSAAAPAGAPRGDSAAVARPRTGGKP